MRGHPHTTTAALGKVEADHELRLRALPGKWSLLLAAPDLQIAGQLRKLLKCDAIHLAVLQSPLAQKWR